MAERHDISTPPASQRHETPAGLQARYDRRLVRNPRRVPPPCNTAGMEATASSSRAGQRSEQIAQRRESAAQIARRRPRPATPPSRLKRGRVEEPAPQRPRVQGPIARAPR